MIEIYLLQSYKGQAEQSIIKVGKSIANDLVIKGIARYTKVRDYLIKPKFGKSKSFKRAPKTA